MREEGTEGEEGREVKQVNEGRSYHMLQQQTLPRPFSPVNLLLITEPLFFYMLRFLFMNGILLINLPYATTKQTKYNTTIQKYYRSK